MKWKTIICAVTVLVGASRIAFADAAPDPLNKGIRPVRKISRVRLVSEQVDIFPGADRCDFVVTMVFRNSGSVSESMEVGFPTSYQNEVLDPQVWIDDRRISTRYDLEEEIVQEEFEGKVNKKTYQTHWILWDMTFEPQKNKTMRMAYWVKPRKNVDYMVTPYTQYRNRIAESFAKKGFEIPQPVKQLLASMTSYSTGYILHTGTGWTDVIGSAVIHVYYKKMGPRRLRWIQPVKNFVADNEKLTWTFHNFEPDFDIDIEYNGRLSIEEELTIVQTLLQQYPSNDALKQLKTYLEKLKSEYGVSR